MLYSEIIAVCSEVNAEHTIRSVGRMYIFRMSKPVDASSNQ